MYSHTHRTHMNTINCWSPAEKVLGVLLDADSYRWSHKGYSVFLFGPFLKILVDGDVNVLLEVGYG